MTPEEQNAQMLQDTLNGYQITDERGEITENDNFVEESAPQEQTTDLEAESSEKSTESLEDAPKANEEESENELAEDESGKRYVPKSRFDKVYGKLKAYERGEIQPKQATPPPATTGDVNALFPQVQQPQVASQATDLETEFLFDKYPEFDPSSPKYNRVLDKIGYDIAVSRPGMSKLAIAREAIQRARDLTANQAEVVAQSRQIKASQSDQGVTSRVTSRTAAAPDFDSMSESEQEQYLKANGLWDSF